MVLYCFKLKMLKLLFLLDVTSFRKAGIFLSYTQKLTAK